MGNRLQGLLAGFAGECMLLAFNVANHDEHTLAGRQ